MSGAALAEAIARITDAWPNVQDRSANPHPAQPGDLPAIALTYGVESTELYCLGSTDLQILGDMTLTVWVPIADTPAARDGMAEAAEQAFSVIGADGDLGGLVDQITPDSWDVEFDAGAERVARLEVRFNVTTIGPRQTAQAPPPLT